jgi:hypothetical protein
VTHDMDSVRHRGSGLAARRMGLRGEVRGAMGGDGRSGGGGWVQLQWREAAVRWRAGGR